MNNSWHRCKAAWWRPRWVEVRRRGFTLTEVLIAVALVALVIGLLMIPIANSVGYFRTATARADAQTTARNALDLMAREISEATYVWQDMNDNTMFAFVPPLRVNPEDPNSQIVTPPRPDWNYAVRYWQALHNPQYNYSVGTTLAQPNPYYLARTVVEDPFREVDEWNTGDDWRYNRNRDWADAVNQRPDQAGVNWAPLTRMVSCDVDRKPSGGVGARNKTLQPGYPYLEATWRYADDLTRQARFYRDHTVGLTPNAVDYDVSALSFEPMVVSGEWLTPGPEKSTYLARYPLWRLGVPYTSWTALGGADPVFGGPDRVPPDWVRDPFLVFYRYASSVGKYAPIAVGCFDPRSRTMKVLRYHDFGQLIYDSGDYPNREIGSLSRDTGSLLGFGVDWINGSLRFDFPPLHLAEAPLTLDRTEDRPLEVAGSELTPTTASGGAAVFEYCLVTEWWGDRPGGQGLQSFILPDSAWIRIDTNGDQRPDRALTRVYRTPRDYSDEFQVGLDPGEPGGAGSAQPKYGWIRLPAHLSAVGEEADEEGNPVRVTRPTEEVETFWIYYRWRNNGVVLAGEGMEQEKPDLVSAYYRTAAVTDIHLTVSRANPSARAGQRVAQSVHMTRRVKLQNVIREIRDVQ